MPFQREKFRCLNNLCYSTYYQNFNAQNHETIISNYQERHTASESNSEDIPAVDVPLQGAEKESHDHGRLEKCELIDVYTGGL